MRLNVKITFKLKYYITKIDLLILKIIIRLIHYC